MMIKVSAGRYNVATQFGLYEIRNYGSKDWRVFNRHGSEIERFTTLGTANEWLVSLNYAPASKKSIKFLRDLVMANTGQPVAQQISGYFGALASQGVVFNQAEVSLAIKRLKNLSDHSETAQVVLPRAKAISSARESVRRARASRV